MSGTPQPPGSFVRGMGDAPLVEFHDLSVSYGAVRALAGVSGAFRPGPTGLLGPNGAGKTTLLKTLLGFLQPDAGTLAAFGIDPARAPLEVRRRVGYMPEVDCHIGGMTAAAFVAFAGELSGLPRDEAVSRAHEVLYYVGLGEARYRNVDTYSTGMKQRVKLAQALVHDPDLLLLDEPTNGLDPNAREEMLGLIHDVATRRGMSLVLCSHLLRDVERVCESVIVVDRGRIAASGVVADLTGPRRSVFDLRVKGEAAGLLEALRVLGGEWHEAEDGYRVFVPEGEGAALLFRLARERGVQVRYLRPGTESLEDVFLRALGHETGESARGLDGGRGQGTSEAPSERPAEEGRGQ
jgi:ABC-2 type transport system ATP-binding protein